MAKSSFKLEQPLERRLAEASRIREKYPDRIPVIVEKAERSDIPDIDKKNLLVVAYWTMKEFVCAVRERIKLSAEKAIFVFVRNARPSTVALMSKIYEESKDEDGFLYVTCSDKADGDYIQTATQLTLGVGSGQPLALQPRMTQGQLSKSKRKDAAVEVSEPSSKRTREVEKVPNKGKARVEVLRTIKLSLELASTDSDFNDSLVAQKIAKSKLSREDKEKVDSHCSVEISKSLRYTGVTLAHATKASEQYKKLSKKYSFYRIQSHLLKKKLKQLKANKRKFELHVIELKSELEKLKRELACSEEERGRLSLATHEALANFYDTAELAAATKHANVEGVGGAFDLAI